MGDDHLNIKSETVSPPPGAPDASRRSSSAQRKRKKKVEIACVYCRRSHMICDDSRPCQRCIKRGIGHLCYDEPSNQRQRKKAAALRSDPPSASGTATPPQAPLVPPSTSSVPASAAATAVAMAPAASASAAPSMASLGAGNHSALLASARTTESPGAYAPKRANSVLSQTLPYNQEPFFYSEHAGSEFSSLNDFLSMIDDPDLVNGALGDDGNVMSSLFGAGSGQFDVGTPQPGGGNNNNNNGAEQAAAAAMASMAPPSMYGSNLTPRLSAPSSTRIAPSAFFDDNTSHGNNGTNGNSAGNGGTGGDGGLPNDLEVSLKPEASSTSINQMAPGHQPVISDSARDKFFLTAADPTTEISPEERLKQVIKAKLEAGLLQPYNYAKGYARLQAYMDNYMNVSSRQRILKPLSIFRPAFRAIARTLKDVDLVLVEESFERMLLDYDRVFTSMAIPACLWRRTGEIYRGNKEFASLVGVKADDLKDGKLAIYELMSEESAVNFWEKYGAIAFDKGQKAVLTSCNLRTKDGIKRKSCCFSFTIRRDRYNIPSCIVGNFIPIDP
ncbi:hypothetical protein DIURU_002260 [Diutina rugosa]|uniref:Zn(2)-C6 fungal-type domain-containing protein n=1 Tax=Diutina rugosa TaxID=5481 RepID=A0A642UR21_DIURU|nr:uncharacterized protein DIURU_002260 [Diutina rugosa]KAA8903748.1 hypothetical protein DIURU_002260 [Diutina rugosa]